MFMMHFWYICNYAAIVHYRNAEIVILLYVVLLYVCRLNDYSTDLKSLKGRRDLLYGRLSEVLVAKV